MEHPLVLFDGVCNLCHRSVQFILHRDPEGVFHFASLQSDLGQDKLREAGLGENPPDSIVLIQESGAYTESDAALRIARELKGFWSVLGRFGLWLPRWFRDPVYRRVARNRYRWFGKKDECPLPDPVWRDRFPGEAD